MKLCAHVHTYSHGSFVIFGNSEEELLTQVRSEFPSGGGKPSWWRVFDTATGKQIRRDDFDQGDFVYDQGYPKLRIR